MMNKKIIAFAFGFLFVVALAVIVSSAERPRVDETNLTSSQGLDTIMQLEIVKARNIGQEDYSYEFSVEKAKALDPLLVHPWLIGDDPDDPLFIFNYDHYTIILTKAIQEQQEQIESQQITIDAMGASLCNLGETRFC